MWQMRSSSKRKAGLQETAPDRQSRILGLRGNGRYLCNEGSGSQRSRMAAMEGRKPNEADLEKDKKENSL